MKLKGKNATRENMLKIIKKEGRIGSKNIDEIIKWKKEGKLLEAFFSVVQKIQYDLQANFHCKFHIEWEKIDELGEQGKDSGKLWTNFTKSIDKLYPLITISNSTGLIDDKLCLKLTKLRELRNQIAHQLIYNEPTIFVTKVEIESAIDEGIEILKELSKIQKEIVFQRV